MLVYPLDSEACGFFSFSKKQKLLFGAFSLVRRDFPCYHFAPYSPASINIRTSDITEAVTKAAAIVEHSIEVPCLYDCYRGLRAVRDPQKHIKEMRATDVYIDMFHAPQELSFPALMASLQPQYCISDKHFRSEFIVGLYERLSKSSRFMHIAIHYFVNATRLVHNAFVEDAGLNLNLVLEALVADVGSRFSIKDKMKAISKLKELIPLSDWTWATLEELYAARNCFLAHADKGMFTSDQNVGDPDGYCCEHFLPISLLLRRYMRLIDNTNSK